MIWADNGALCNNVQVLVPYLLAICERIVTWSEKRASHFSLGCMYEPGVDSFKLFNAAGLWISLWSDFVRLSKGWDFIHVLKCLCA